MADLETVFSLSGSGGPICPFPLGERTTILDIADRDEMDDEMFPLTSDLSWFTRRKGRRLLPYTPVLQEFTQKNEPVFGGTLTFELGSVKACDILLSVGLQLQLGHWLNPQVVEYLTNGRYEYVNPSDMWLYTSSLGTCLIEWAEFQLNDQVLERVDGDFSNLFSLLFSDINTQFGIGIDAYGRYTASERLAWPQTQVFPTTNGVVTCILPFSFQRIRCREGFPLVAVKEGTVRIVIKLRPFAEVVRRVDMIRLPGEGGCNSTPLGQEFRMRDLLEERIVTVKASEVEPPFLDARLVTYGIMTDGLYRGALLRAPFERIYREVQTFRFAEPLKYTVGISNGEQIRVQLPLELNHPVEEIIWVVRRKAVALDSEWTNYGAVLELYQNPETNAQMGLLDGASIQFNGETIVEGSADFFRQEIAQAHKGGIIAYKNYVYGYSFARRPGRKDPSGTLNTSRSTDVRLRLDVTQKNIDGKTNEWEVLVYAIALNWVRFENGMCNRLFSS